MMSSSSSSAAAPDNGILRVALCQFPVTNEKDVNHRTASDYIDRAASSGAKLCVLPEVWNSPYATAAFPEYAERLPEVGEAPEEEKAPSAVLLRDKAAEHGLWLVGGSVPEEYDGNYYNTCLVFDPDGKIVAKHRKVHLFDIDVPGKITFFESDTLSPGNSYSHFETPFGTVGVGICYDIRFAEYAMVLCRDHNCRILVYPGAFNLTTGPAHWELLQRARANDNQCYVLTASPARSDAPKEEGKYPHYSAWGHSTATSPWGDVVATTDEKEGIVIADLDLSKVEEVRKSIPILQQKRPDLYELSKVSK